MGTVLSRSVCGYNWNEARENSAVGFVQLIREAFAAVWREREGILASMKKMMLLGALLAGVATVGHAQESRQDASVSAYGLFGPEVHGLGTKVVTDPWLGFLGSYRYDLTPRSQLELNYSFTQTSLEFTPPGRNPAYVHTRQQEISGAYVYTRSYHHYNPFLEAGVGGMIFTPIHDYETSALDTRQNTNIGALFGGGLAYEISPSFDIRVEYRGFVVKTPDFGKEADGYKTNRYELLSLPSLGVAYHF
jgi:outer membrane immunogenic protein